MKWIFVLTVCLFLLGCGSPLYHDIRDTQEPQVQEEPMKFSNDPILDGKYRAEYLEMLRRCGSGDDMCRK